MIKTKIHVVILHARTNTDTQIRVGRYIIRKLTSSQETDRGCAIKFVRVNRRMYTNTYTCSRNGFDTVFHIYPSVQTLHEKTYETIKILVLVKLIVICQRTISVFR